MNCPVGEKKPTGNVVCRYGKRKARRCAVLLIPLLRKLEKGSGNTWDRRAVSRNGIGVLTAGLQ